MGHGTGSRKALLVSLFLFSLVGCGNDGGSKEASGDNTTTEAFAQGVFIDSGVSGLTYRSGPASGTTDATGAFQYHVLSGEPQTVTFLIGEMELGSAVGQQVLTPMDILGAVSTSDPRVINLLRLLQTLDDDNNPDNGIVLTEAVQRLFLTDTALDLSTDIFNGSEPLASILIELDVETSEIVAPEDAVEHFEESLLAGTNRPLYTLGGVASGLLDAASLVLGNETLVVEEDGLFQFTGKVFDQTDYSILLDDPGVGQICDLTNASNTVKGRDVTNIILQCRSNVFPLNLVTTGIDQPFDVAFQVSGVQQTMTLDPVVSGPVLLSLDQVESGAFLDSFSFTSLPTGIAGCVLADQPDLVSGSALAGSMPPVETNLLAQCSSRVSVANATTGNDLIADPALRACIESSVPADVSWDSLTRLTCPYSGGSVPQISSLEGIERFVNLAEVNFSSQNISNVDPLLSLLKLESAFLTDNPLTLGERKKLNVLDELDQTVFVSGSGTAADANQIDDVEYFASVGINDSEIHVISGQDREINITYDAEGCAESKFQEFTVRSKQIGDTDFSFQAFEPCGVSSRSVFIDNNSFSARDKQQVEFDFTFGGNLDDKDVQDQLYAEFDFVPVAIPQGADVLNELQFSDANMASCLIDLVGSPTALVSSIVALNLADCPTPPTDLMGIEQLVALESLNVGNLSVSSTGLFSELVFLDAFSRSTTTPLTDKSWRVAVQDDRLLACLDQSIAANFDENDSGNSNWLNWEDVDRIMCPGPVEADPGSIISDLGGIAQFEQLVTLSVSGHPVSDGIGALRKLPVLTELELEPSQLFRDEWVSSGGQSIASRRNPRYQFTLAEPQFVEIQLIDPNPPSTDPYLYLLDEDGTEIASNDDFDFNGDQFLDELDSRVEVLLAPGSYEVVAATFNSGRTGPFQISANVELEPVLRKLKTPLFADDVITGAGTSYLQGFIENALDTFSFAYADVDIVLSMSQPTVFFESAAVPQINVNVSVEVDRSEDGGGGFGNVGEFERYGYRYSVQATDALGQTFSSPSVSCNADLSSFSTACFNEINIQPDIANMSLAAGEYEVRVNYEAFYKILDKSSHTTSVDTRVVVLQSSGCETTTPGSLPGSFSSIDFSACPSGTEVNLSGIDKLYQLQSLDLGRTLVIEGMESLLRVTEAADIQLGDFVVDLGDSDLLADFVADPALRQCISDRLPDFYNPAVDRLTSLDCSGYGIYHLDGLEYLQTLRSVNLSDNLLEDDDVQALQQLPLLLSVNVTGNQLSFAEITALQSYFDGIGAVFAPSGSAPVVPTVTLTPSQNGFEVSWVEDASVTRYDLLYRFDGDSFYRIATSSAPPVNIGFSDVAVPYEVLLVVSNSLGSDSVTVNGSP